MNNWQPIETAPKGGGAEHTDDPKWSEPPKILLAFEDGRIEVGYWDWYYAPGGNGYVDGRSAWVAEDGHIGEEPTHWMPLPPSPHA